MNKLISRFAVACLTLLLLLGGSVPPASALEPAADLALTKTADTKNVKIGENITFTITVINLGPDTATGIYFGDALPDPAKFCLSVVQQGPHHWWRLRGG